MVYCFQRKNGRTNGKIQVTDHVKDHFVAELELHGSFILTAQLQLKELKGINECKSKLAFTLDLIHIAMIYDIILLFWLYYRKLMVQYDPSLFKRKTVAVLPAPQREKNKVTD